LFSQGLFLLQISRTNKARFQGTACLFLKRQRDNSHISFLAPEIIYISMALPAALFPRQAHYPP
jgi:hypothetical protein